MKVALTSLMLVMSVACSGPDSGSGDSSKNRNADAKQGTEIGNGNKIEPEQTPGPGSPEGAGTNAGTGSQPDLCPGVTYGNFCVQLSSAGQSCSGLCQGRGNVSPVTYKSFGTENSGAQCTVVLRLLLENEYEVSVSPANGAFPATGCSIVGNDAYVYFAGKADPDAKRENLRRVCICK